LPPFQRRLVGGSTVHKPVDQPASAEPEHEEAEELVRGPIGGAEGFRVSEDGDVVDHDELPAMQQRPAAAEADEYFATRPKQAQIGAWASKQSQPLESRFAFEQAIAKEGAKYLIGEVPRPPGWSGWRITPVRIEFWHDRPFRLHDRIEFRREAAGSAWSKVRMYP